MRQLRHIIAIVATATLALACSEKSQETDDSAPLELKKISATLGSDIDVGMATRAGVVTASDPSTTPISERGANLWKVDIKLYKGATPYTYGVGTYTWDTSNSWIYTSGAVAYFPNYTTQTAEFTLYPVTPNATVAIDQSVDLTMLNQDILYIKNTVVPSHTVSATLKHAQSMLDFTFEKTPHDINTVHVEVGSPATTYTPYKVPGTSKYLLILPSVTTVTDPTIVVTTTSGATYRQLVRIIGTASNGNLAYLGVNYRYIFKLIGLELGLSPVSVVDWISGGMVAGDYVGVTAYPTFRGRANQSCIIYFDNGLNQTLQFNSQGECTAKPVGRKIIRVEVNGISCDTSVILGQMIIDLNAQIDQCMNIT